MKNVVVKVRKGELLGLLQLGVEAVRQKSLCEFCFDLVIENNMMYLEFFDDIYVNGKKIRIDGRISDGIPVISVDVENPENKEIRIGLRWRLNECLKVIQSCSDVVELRFNASEQPDMIVGTNSYPDNLFTSEETTLSL